MKATKFVVLLLSQLLVLSATSSDGIACRIDRPLTPDQIQKAHVVFRGRIDTFQRNESSNPILLVFRVKEMFRGSRADTHKVHWTRFGGPQYPNHIYEFMAWYGSEVVVFAHQRSDGALDLVQSSCGPSALLRWEGQNVRELLRTGTIPSLTTGRH